MTKVGGAFEAKTHFSKLLERVEAGEVIQITRHGRLVAELRPVTATRPIPKPGLFKGRIRLSEDFDEPLGDKSLDAYSIPRAW
jgi:prevent-host-death family protein